MALCCREPMPAHRVRSEETAGYPMLFPAPHFTFLPEYCRGETGRSRRKRGLSMLREASRTLHLQRSRYGLAQILAMGPDRTLLSSR